MPVLSVHYLLKVLETTPFSPEQKGASSTGTFISSHSKTIETLPKSVPAKRVFDKLLPHVDQSLLSFFQGEGQQSWRQLSPVF